MYRFVLTLYIFSILLTATTLASTNCLYEQDPFSADADPYQSRPTFVEPNFINHLYKKRDPIEFYEDGLADENGKPRANDMQLMGNYVIDYNSWLGYGDKGTVWLAQHLPTKIFVAVKAVTRRWCEPQQYPDVLSLKKLQRLYGLFTGDYKNMEKTFFFMPLAHGVASINLQYCEDYPVKAVIEVDTLKINNLDVGLHLISCFIKEIEYFAKRGYYQVDAQAGHLYVCNNFKSVCIIDYDGTQSTESIPESEWDISPFRWSLVTFLGIHERGVFESYESLPADKLSQLKNPPYLISFLKAITPYQNQRRGHSLTQLKEDFKILQTNLEY
jgi:hypothetical protein